MSKSKLFYRNTLNRRRQVPSRGGLPDSSLALSAHDLHRFGMQLNSIQPVCHFHLAASINADTGTLLIVVFFSSKLL